MIQFPKMAMPYSFSLWSLLIRLDFWNFIWMLDVKKIFPLWLDPNFNICQLLVPCSTLSTPGLLAATICRPSSGLSPRCSFCLCSQPYRESSKGLLTSGVSFLTTAPCLVPYLVISSHYVRRFELSSVTPSSSGPQCSLGLHLPGLPSENCSWTHGWVKLGLPSSVFIIYLFAFHYIFIYTFYLLQSCTTCYPIPENGSLKTVLYFLRWEGWASTSNSVNTKPRSQTFWVGWWHMEIVF